MPVVNDYTALLEYLEPGQYNSFYRWNAPLDAGSAGAVVTYSFLSGADLPAPGSLSRGVTDVNAFTAAQQAAFRAAADIFEAAANIRLIETDSDPMIEIVGVTPTSATLGGWASYPGGYPYQTTSAFDPGIYAINTNRYPDPSTGHGFETLLHELGHALGLKHSFDGTTTLASSLDDTSNTLMSYTDGPGGPYATLQSFDLQALEHIYGSDQRSQDWAITPSGQGWKIVGTGAADSIVAPVDEVTLNGKGGNDTLSGRIYDDVIKGQGGNDTIYGQDGADRLLGGGGADRIYAYFDSSQTDYDDDGNVLKGGGGGDRLYSGRGADTLDGGKGKDRLFGGEDGDHLNGGGGADALDGGDGFDTLYGGGGKDKLTGGEGYDFFVFAARAGTDTITDFELVSGGVWGDRISFEGAGLDHADGTISAYSGGTRIDFEDANFAIRIKGISPADFQSGYWDYET
jgi:Ca2+-binding RTX toxin-like protein